MKKVFITGASRGIGAATAKRFINEGYQVIMPRREEMELSSLDSIKLYFENNRNLDVDCIVNNAGINPIAAIEDISEKDLFETMNINLVAPLLIIKALVGKMKNKNYGRIVNIGSIWSVVSKEKRSVYSMTKNGIHGLTNSLAVELGKFNILVNTVCPGFTNTELTKKNVPDAEVEKIVRTIPLGRFAEPAEIADVIYFLGSEKNTYITGHKLTVDGGFTVK